MFQGVAVELVPVLESRGNVFAVCCSVLQCVAVSTCLQYVDDSSVLQCMAVCCSVLQCVAVCETALQCVAVCDSV